MKIITIGDLHGLPVWKKIAPDDWDHIVFIGDYVDSFYFPDNEIVENLEEIIKLKKANPEKVILLWGNHDLGYLFRGASLHGCSGFRREMLEPLAEIFNNNRNLFQTAWQAENYLWTHAGIVQRWFANFIENQVIPNDINLAATLNRLFDAYYLPLFHVSHVRGGRQWESGPFWADMSETMNDPIRGFHQVVGHTHTREGIFTYNHSEGETSVTFTDCLETKYRFFELQL